MSLYDGVDESVKPLPTADSSSLSGLSTNLQYMKTQLQLKKASALTKTGPQTRKPCVPTPQLTPLFNNVAVVEEYDPYRPNDYEECKEKIKAKKESKRLRGEKQADTLEPARNTSDMEDNRHESSLHESSRHESSRHESSRHESSRHESSRHSDSDRSRKSAIDREEEPPRSSGLGATFAPPPSYNDTPSPAATEEERRPSSLASFNTGGGVASQIMARYGWKEGQGLGKLEQGLSTCLQVEKTSRKGGKIINKDMDAVKPIAGTSEVPREKITSIVDAIKNPSKIILLKNMVGPGEVDDDLQYETQDECNNKYGLVKQVLIFEIPGAAPDEAVRIFVEFEKVESAIKAMVDLNGRYFGGRQVAAAFYDPDKFRRYELAD